MRCCSNCSRIITSTTITTTGITPFFCMCFQKYVFPFNICYWYLPMSGYEQEAEHGRIIDSKELYDGSVIVVEEVKQEAEE